MLKSLQLKSLLLLIAVLMGGGSVWAEEVVYKTALFGSTYNSKGVSSYTDTWTATNAGFTVSLTNFNNNNNGWDYVKCGRKNNASVATITTDAAIDEAITKVSVTIDAITAAKVNSIKLYTSSDNSSWTEAGSYTAATDAQTVTLTNPTENLYYKIEFDCASGTSNGLVTVSKIEYYKNEGADDTRTATSITIDDSGITNTNVYGGNAAGTLAATVKAGNEAVQNATVTWSTEDTGVATVDEQTGAITLVAAGTATITASYAGSDIYKPSTATYTLTVTNSDPNAAGTENNPYTVAQARAAIDANTSVNGVYATGIVSKIVTNYNSTYGNISFDISTDGETESDQLRAYRCGGTDAANVQVGDIVVVSGNLTKYNSIYEFSEGCQLVSLEHPAIPVVPIIDAENVSIAYDATSGEIAYTIINPVEGKTLTATSTDEWISNIVVDADKVTFTATTNEGDADRTATITLSYEGAADKAITVTQRHFEVDYATLPFEYDGNGQNELPAGFTVSGLGTYTTSPAMKFDTTGDYAILKINEAPGKLTFDIKGNSFSGGTFTVQTSEDGVTYTDLETYTELGDTQNEVFNNLAENVRYIKWIYTNKVSGNVALGNIKLEKPEAPSTDPVITIAEKQVEVSADAHDGTLDLTYQNLTITKMTDFDIQFFDADGNELNEGPAWLEVLVAEQDPQVGEGYVVSYTIEANDGEARTAYFKVYTLDDDANYVYSELITVTQAKYVVDYATLPFNWDGGTKEDLTGENGVTASGLGTNYAEGNNPYRVKLDTTGDYIQVKTDGQIYNVTLDVKMLGGSNTSYITVQGSSNGDTFTDVEELTISGAQNDILNLETSKAFDANDRYVRLLFTKGSNVGVGAITINLVKKSISAAGYATYCSPVALDFTNSGLTAYVATKDGSNITFSPVDQVPANTGVLLKGSEGDYTINTTDGGNLSAMQNLFIGVLEDTEVSAPIFVLMNGSDGVGFYKTTQAFTVGAHTAYLPASAGARSFIGFDNTTTAIEGIANVERHNGEVYNLQGQRVAKAQKGLYIINGKKMVIK